MDVLTYARFGEVVSRIFVREGVRGFYKGFVFNVVCVLLSLVIMFVVYEGVLGVLNDDFVV